MPDEAPTGRLTRTPGSRVTRVPLPKSAASRAESLVPVRRERGVIESSASTAPPKRGFWSRVGEFFRGVGNTYKVAKRVVLVGAVAGGLAGSQAANYRAQRSSVYAGANVAAREVAHATGGKVRMTVGQKNFSSSETKKETTVVKRGFGLLEPKTVTRDVGIVHVGKANLSARAVGQTVRNPALPVGRDGFRSTAKGAVGGVAAGAALMGALALRKKVKKSIANRRARRGRR